MLCRRDNSASIGDMLETSFSALGLNEEETTTYLSLLETGPITVGALSHKLGKPRPSLYGFLKRLQDKGLVTQSSKAGVRTYLAEAPEKVGLLFQKKLDDLSREHHAYQEMLPSLLKKIPSAFLSPKFQLYEGAEGLQFVLKDMLLYRNIETQAFWPIKAMVDILSPEFFRYHNKERIKNNIYTRAIWPMSQVVEIKKHPYLGAGKEFRREIRIAPKEADFSMGYWIYKNKVAFISSRKESFGFIIESRELVEMLLAQFEIMWKLSKPITIKPGDTAAFLKEIEGHR